MTKTQTNIAAAHRFISKNGILGAYPAVGQVRDGRFASMVHIISKNAGRSTILHLGFAKTEAIANKFAASNAIAFSSI